MRRVEYELLLAACRAMSLGESSQEVDLEALENAESIRDELDGFLGEILKDRQRESKNVEVYLQPWLSVYDLALLQLCDLSFFAWRNRNTKTKVLWPNEDLPDRPSRTGVLYLLTSNLAQSALAVRTLLVQGFEGQSRAMVRSFFEIADALLVITADVAFYRYYITAPEEESLNFQHWRQHLSPAVVRRRLAILDETRPLYNRLPASPSEVRDDTYRWFSRFAHVDMVAHLVSAYLPHPNGDTVGPNAMLGGSGEMSRSTLARILIYLWLFFLRFDSLMIDVHRWQRFRGRNSRDRYFMRAEVFDYVFVKNYRTLHLMEH